MSNASQMIGAFFRKFREEAGFDEKTVAEHLGFDSAELVAQYESGEKSIPINQVFQFANLYDVPPDEIVALFYDLALVFGVRAEKKTGE